MTRDEQRAEIRAEMERQYALPCCYKDSPEDRPPDHDFMEGLDCCFICWLYPPPISDDTLDWFIEHWDEWRKWYGDLS